jgi:hypothetical protein
LPKFPQIVPPLSTRPGIERLRIDAFPPPATMCDLIVILFPVAAVVAKQWQRQW